MEVLVSLADIRTMPVLEYDATIDHIYWAVKSLFPDQDDTFTYDMMYHPAKCK